jgi:hypothetical protein
VWLSHPAETEITRRIAQLETLLLEPAASVVQATALMLVLTLYSAQRVVQPLVTASRELLREGNALGVPLSWHADVNANSPDPAIRGLSLPFIRHCGHRPDQLNLFRATGLKRLPRDDMNSPPGSGM